MFIHDVFTEEREQLLFVVIVFKESTVQVKLRDVNVAIPYPGSWT